MEATWGQWSWFCSIEYQDSETPSSKQQFIAILVNFFKLASDKLTQAGGSTYSVFSTGVFSVLSVVCNDGGKSIKVKGFFISLHLCSSTLMVFQRQRCEVHLQNCSIEESNISVRDASWINKPSHKAGSIIGQNLETLSQCGAGGQWTHHFRSEAVHPTLPPTVRCSFSRVLSDSLHIFTIL